MENSPERIVKSLPADEKAKTLLHDLISEKVRRRISISIVTFSSLVFVYIVGFSVLVFTYSLFLDVTI